MLIAIVLPEIHTNSFISSYPIKQTLVNMGLIDNVWNMYPFNANQLNGDWILAFNGESLEGKQGEMSIDDFLMTTLRDSTKVDPAFPFSLA
ncbi:hypothetical protein CSKR_202375, partial [Clonorchis sinensis]